MKWSVLDEHFFLNGKMTLALQLAQDFTDPVNALWVSLETCYLKCPTDHSVCVYAY